MKSLKILFVLLIIIISVVPLFGISSNAKADFEYEQFESHNSGDSADTHIYGTTWSAQTFAVITNTSHTVSVVRLKLYASGTPGTVTVSIRKTNSGVPTGEDLTSGVLDGSSITTDTDGSFYNISVTEYSLEAGVTYAVVVRAIAGTAANYIGWRYSGNTYTEGTSCSSSDSGYNWSSGSNDYMFSVTGTRCLNILYPRVFKNYRVTGDWLISFVSFNTTPPKYQRLEPSVSYSYQLLTNTTIIATVKLRDWGFKPLSIYLSPSLASTLNWGSSDYTLKAIEIGGTNEFEISTSEFSWEESLLIMDEWVLYTAYDIGEYYGVSLLEDIADESGFRTVLTDTGAQIYVKGIPAIDEVRPNLFNSDKIDSDTDYDDDWDPGEIYNPGGLQPFGPDITERLNEIAGVLGLNFQWAGILFIGILYLGMAAACYAGTKNGAVSVALPLPTIAAGAFFGVFGMALVATLTLVCVAAFLYIIWLRST